MKEQRETINGQIASPKSGVNINISQIKSHVQMDHSSYGISSLRGFLLVINSSISKHHRAQNGERSEISLAFTWALQNLGLFRPYAHQTSARNPCHDFSKGSWKNKEFLSSWGTNFHRLFLWDSWACTQACQVPSREQQLGTKSGGSLDKTCEEHLKSFVA